MKLWKIVVMVLLLNQAVFATEYYYVARTGDGVGASYSVPANYLSSTFWTKVQNRLASTDVKVFFKSGNYDRGTLDFEVKNIMGDNSHRLYLQAYIAYAARFNSSGVNCLLNLTGSHNVTVDGMTFTGGCLEYPVHIMGSSSYDIEIKNCDFIDLPQMIYCGIRIASEAHSIQVINCDFINMGIDYLAHGIYVLWSCYDIEVSDCIFEDISGGYLVFRDNIDDVIVSDNLFHNTGTFANESSPVAISIHNSNHDLEDTEIFGDYYTICGNVFDFADNGLLQYPISWSHLGHEEPVGSGLQIPTDEGAVIFADGSPGAKRGVLADAGVIAKHINIYDNTYLGKITARERYSWDNEKTGSAYRHGSADINEVFYQTQFANDWEDDNEFNGWSVVEHNPDTIVGMSSDHAHGSWSLLLADNSSGYFADVHKSNISSVQRGYWRQWVKVGTGTTSSVYPLFTNVGSSGGTIYWIKANTNHKWGNNSGDFSGSPTWNFNTWYFVEIVFNFAIDRYTVWIDYELVGTFVIPTSNSTMFGSFKIQGPTTAGTGNMWTDFIELGSYEP